MKKKVLFIASSLKGGGAERVFLNIINSLSLDKYDLMLISTTNHLVEDKLKDGVKYKSYNKKHAKSCFLKLLKDVNGFAPDYVFTSHFPVAYMLPFIKLFSKKKFKSIIRIAVPPSDMPVRFSIVGLKAVIAKFISKFAYKKINTIIAQTDSMKKDIIKHYSVDPNKIKVIRNIIDKDFLEKKGNEACPIELDVNHYNIVAAGALYSVKGYDLLIKAMRAVVEKYPKSRLYILGEERYETGYKDKLGKLILELALQNNVFMLGFKENPYPFFKNANLFVLSSRNEGYPNVVLEAIYYKTPVVVTDCVDFNGIVQSNINGYIVSKNSVESLSEGILLAHDNLSKNYAFNIDNFNYEKLFK